MSPRRAPRPKLSAELREIAAGEGERVSVADIAAGLGRRSFGALMLIFAFPNILPAPPGTSGVLGLPLIFLSTQLMAGRMPWLPSWIARRSVRRADFAALVERAAPWLTRAERLLRPRLTALAYGPAENVIGLVCLALSLTLALPVPFGNLLPALAICVFALALLERDGLWTLVGFGVATVAMGVAGGMAYAAVKAALFVFEGAFR